MTLVVNVSNAPFNGVTVDDDDLGLGVQMEDVMGDQHPGFCASFVTGEEPPVAVVKEVARTAVPCGKEYTHTLPYDDE